MMQNVNTSSRLINLDGAQLILSHHPAWIYIESERQLLPSADLARFIESPLEAIKNEKFDASDPDHLEIDCLLIPGDRKMVKSISLMANLQNALDLMQQHQIEWLVVHRDEQFNQVVGIISREMVEQYYRYQPQAV